MAKTKKYPSTEFTKRLKDLWLKSGMTQKQIADEAGVSRWTVKAWLEGEIILGLPDLVCLCRLFNVSADYLLFGEEGENAVHTP